MRTDAYYSSGMRIDFGYSRTSVQASKMRIKYAESVSLGKYEIKYTHKSIYASNFRLIFKLKMGTSTSFTQTLCELTQRIALGGPSDSIKHLF